MPTPQDFKNHTRFDPPFHYLLMPILLINFIFSIVATVRHWPTNADLFVWWIVMSFALMILAFKSRANALKAQDRVIRLEEQLRMRALLSAADFARTSELTPSQYVALRFASDAELPTLVKRALEEKLTPKQIKASIVDWRPDYLRV